MEQFVNRESEIELIDKAFGQLLDKEHLLRTPIIDFYGVEGIGKSSILKQVRQKCEERKVRYIDVNMSQGFTEFWQKFSNNAHKDGQPPLQYESELVAQSTEMAKALLAQAPLVMLLDAVDATNESQVEHLETFLAELLLLYNNLFVILTSRRSVSFERKKSVKRQLTAFLVRPLDRDNSRTYLKNLGHPLLDETQDLILEWTRGYPLAMNVMVEAIAKQGMDPISEQGKKQLITLIIERVIDQGILISVAKDEHPWYHTVLRLLAVPRRFNLLMMQQLIERFEPQLKLSSNLAYMPLYRKITRDTGILSWDMTKAGLALDDSVRNILLLDLRITYPERYADINRFLAAASWQKTTSDEIRGTDRIHYYREYLYHSAINKSDEHLSAFLQTTIEQMIQDIKKDSDQLMQFREEFLQDHELQDVLGKHATIVITLLDQALGQKMDDTTAEG